MHAVFLFQRCIPRIEILTRSYERLTKLKPNKIFNDFAISWDPINEIDPDFFYFKDMD